jgi:hypothetical protein
MNSGYFYTEGKEGEREQAAGETERERVWEREDSHKIEWRQL